jgi:beta-lactam-binding protein with PASTA domain
MRIRRHLAPATQWPNPFAGLAGALHGHGATLYAGTFVGALIVGYVVAALVFFPAPIFASSKSVPSLLGLTADQAQQSLSAAGLKVEKMDPVRHPTAPRGTVVWQDPPAGVVVPQGSSVQLSVSQGPQPVPVPDVVGYDGTIGQSLIQASGLKVGSVDSAQTAAAKGVIVGTRPTAGKALDPGGRVTLVVSKGAPTITVPNLSGLTLDSARTVLEQANLTLGTYWRRSSDARPGTVIHQEPPVGTLSSPGVAVDVILARGPKP